MPPPFNINENSPAPSDIISSYPVDEQAFRTVVEEWLSWISDPATGLLRESVLPAAFPAGTRMLFLQSSAPTGWTKETDAAYNDAAIRIVTGSVGPTGGTVAFSTAMASQAVAGSVGSTALTQANLPPHSHTFSGNTGFVSNDHQHFFSGTFGTDAQGNHTHTGSNGANLLTHVSPGVGPVAVAAGSTAQPVGSTNAAGLHAHNVTVSGWTGGISANHFHAFSGTTSSVGSGTGHTHTFTGTPINLAVKYADAIVATRDAS